MFKWFKKKKVPKQSQMDLSQYKMQLNLKSICYFEKITGVSFFKFTDEHVLYLIYATFLVNNPQTKISYSVFEGIMHNPQIAKWAISQFDDAIKLIQQFNQTIEENKDDKFSMEQTNTMTDFATSLVIDYGMDVNYVMYQMDIWEIGEFFEAVNTHIRRKMEYDRFWTYMQVMPHIDTKKCKSPDKLLPFDWEKEEKKNKQDKELQNNMFAIKNMIGKNIFGEPIENTDKDGK